MHQQAQKAPCVHSPVLLLWLWITHGVGLREKLYFSQPFILKANQNHSGDTGVMKIRNSVY